MNLLRSFLKVRFFICVLTLYPACTSCESEDHCSNSSVIDHYVERDLELFHSVDHSRPGVITSAIDKTYTSFGKAQLEKHIKNPIRDTDILRSRQRQISLLLENPQLLNLLRKTLAHIKTHEEGLTYFIDAKKDPIVENAIKNFYFNSEWLKNFNKNPYALDGRNYAKYLGLFGPVLEHLIFHFALDLLQEKADGSDKCNGHDKTHKHAHSHGPKLPKNASFVLKGGFILLKVGHFAIHAISIKEMIEKMSSEKSLINQLHKKVASTKECLSGIKKIFALMKSNGYSPEAFGLSSSSFEYFKDPQNKAINNLVNDDSFKENTSIGFFSPVGKTLSYYRTLENEVSSLKSLTYMLGDIDSLVSIAEWYLKVNDETNKACLVKFIPSSATPVLNLKNFWNIALDSNKAIANDVELGEDKTLNIVLTGPNKTGKSSTLKAIGINIILAQTYGIMAAEWAEMSVVNKLISHITVIDDISNDSSMMVAEMIRVDRCMKTLHNLKKNQHACVLIDDSLFKGTTFEKGQELAYQFIKGIGSMPNCYGIIATHMPILATLELEENSNFKNYCIDIALDEQGNAYSTFRLKKGLADHRSVFDILKSKQYQIE